MQISQPATTSFSAGSIGEILLRVIAPPVEANLVNYLWPLLIVLLSAPLAGERLGWPHLSGALLGFAGVALLAFGRGVHFTGAYALGYVLALGCALTWALYSVLSRRFGETPTDAIAAFCTVSAALSLTACSRNPLSG
jgi:drug/metabolite transporter (DMT)-like permease